MRYPARRPSLLELVLVAVQGTSGACSRLIGQTIAGIPVHVYQKLSKGELVEIPNHPLMELLEDSDWKKLIFSTSEHIELTGRAYILMDGPAKGFVTKLKLLQVQDVIKVRDSNNNLLYYQYGTQKFTPDQIIDFTINHPLGEIYDGLGSAERSWVAIQQLREDGERMLRANRYGPRQIISPAPNETGSVLTQAQERRIMAWHAQSDGTLPGVAPIPITVTPMEPSSRDQEGVARISALRTIICNTFQVPQAMLESQKSRAELEGAMEQFHRICIDPRTTFIEGCMNKQLASRYGDGIELRFEASDYEDAEALAPADGGTPGKKQDTKEDGDVQE